MTSDRDALADRLIPDIERAVSLARDFVEGSKPYDEAVRSVALDAADTVMASRWRPPAVIVPGWQHWDAKYDDHPVLDVITVCSRITCQQPILPQPEIYLQGVPFVVDIPEGEAVQGTCDTCGDILTVTRGSYVHYCSAAGLAEKRAKA